MLKRLVAMENDVMGSLVMMWSTLFSRLTMIGVELTAVATVKATGSGGRCVDVFEGVDEGVWGRDGRCRTGIL